MPARRHAGGPPTNLRQVIANGPNGDETVIDRVESVIRHGGFMKDAAARVGVRIETLRNWLAIGNRCARELTQEGGRRLSRMQQHERDCIDLAARVERAEADARMGMLLLVEKLAVGGFERKTTVEKVNAAGQVVERTTTTAIAAPDGAMATWWLRHRHPHDFAVQRVELTGAGGGPIEVDAGNVVDKLRERLREVATAAAEASPDAMDQLLATATGNGHNGNGNGDHP